MIKCVNGKTELAGKAIDLALEANCILLSLHTASPELLVGLITGWARFATEKVEEGAYDMRKLEAVMETTNQFIEECKNE